uniref:Sulfatase N-terminal domain-containing protein n=1 Tax=Panagrolaimus sp. ES5 TaxID=591445 RepID=A0AC34GA04_9BILA
MTKYDIPKFGILHHSLLSHDNISSVNIIDEDLKAHFQQLFEGGYFDNAIVFVASDHGHRFSALRETQQGQLEERLPFMSIALPEKFKSTEKGKKIYRNLKANADSLTTPFDIYETFQDILSLPDELDTEQSNDKRGLSLFRPISKTRTCQDADIQSHWCTCLRWQKGNNIIAEKLATAVVETINDYTKIERNLCAPLNIDKILNSKKLVPNEQLLKYAGSTDIDGQFPKFNENAVATFATYMIIFTTSPGNAKYEATVQYDEELDKITVDMLTISHINKYGDTAHCIIDKNYFLATYCVCYDKINKT